MNQLISVEVVFCPEAGICHQELHRLQIGASLEQFLAQIDWYGRFPETGQLSHGVFGQKVGSDYLLKNHDRIEFYRPLPLDPMKLRKQRVLKNKALKKAKNT